MLITKVQKPENLTAQHILCILAGVFDRGIENLNFRDIVEAVLDALVNDGTLG
jgi:hypothetical protein